MSDLALRQTHAFQKVRKRKIFYVNMHFGTLVAFMIVSFKKKERQPIFFE